MTASPPSWHVCPNRKYFAVLQWRHIVVPHWHIPYDRMVYWDKFGRPKVTPVRGAQFMSWWIDPLKAEDLAKRRKSTKSN